MESSLSHFLLLKPPFYGWDTGWGGDYRLHHLSASYQWYASILGRSRMSHDCRRKTSSIWPVIGQRISGSVHAETQFAQFRFCLWCWISQERWWHNHSHRLDTYRWWRPWLLWLHQLKCLLAAVWIARLQSYSCYRARAIVDISPCTVVTFREVTLLVPSRPLKW